MKNKKVLAFILAGVTMLSSASMSASAKVDSNKDEKAMKAQHDGIVIAEVYNAMDGAKQIKVSKSESAKKPKLILIAHRGRAFNCAYHASPRARVRANENSAVKRVQYHKAAYAVARDATSQAKLEGEREITLGFVDLLRDDFIEKDR